MASEVIFRQQDEDDGTTLRVNLRGNHVKMAVNGPTSFTFLEPQDVVDLRDALTAAIEKRGWGK